MFLDDEGTVMSRQRQITNRIGEETNRQAIWTAVDRIVSERIARPNAQTSAFIEVMEPRRLLSALTITGTASADNIQLSTSGGTMSVTVNGATITLSSSSVTSIQIDAGDGNDTVTLASSITQPASITGGNGDDTLTGGAGDDSLTGGSGNDTYVYSGSANLGSDSITEAAAADTDTLDFSGMSSAVSVDLNITTTQTINSQIHLMLSSGTGIENVNGSAFNDTIVGNVRNNVIHGNAGNDNLYGETGYGDPLITQGNDTIFGDAGNDYLAGDSDFGGWNIAGNDSLSGGDGNDTLYGDGTGSAGFEEEINYAGNDTLDGGAGDDHLIGDTAAFDDVIGGNDSLIGGAGNDTYSFDGFYVLGNDTIVEAANVDTDTLDFSGFYYGIGVDLSATTAQTVTDHVLTLMLSDGTGIENVTGSVYTTEHDIITGNSRDNVLIGSAQSDILNGAAGNDTLSGENGDDTITGATGNDLLDGGGGNDSYFFSGSTNLGTDTVNEAANADTDTLDFSGFGQGAILDIGATGNQTISSGKLVLNISAESSIENVNGSAFNDNITGNSRNNVIHGGAGDDQLSGDNAYGDQWTGIAESNDTIFGDAGNDIVSGDSYFGVWTTAGNDSLSGGDGNDTIYGDGHGDIFDPGTHTAGHDTISGDNGNDLIYGDVPNFGYSVTSASDTIDGGAGTDSVSNNDGLDTITNVEVIT
jgi:Ca2+-binding RTX toxin-like protein